MSHYVIGIGGTGAKIIESLVHLTSAGLMPSGDLNILFVDPDEANGILERARVTIKSYINCHEIQRGDIELFRTKISTFNPDFWSPLAGHSNPRLDNFLLYNTLPRSAAALFDVLYSDEEKTTELNMGFRGHPSIGSAIMASTVNSGTSNPWSDFMQRVRNEHDKGEMVKIFFCGSIFGGTGASGFPTIARLIRNELKEFKNVKLGGSLILPYFSFTSGACTDLRASSDNFQMNTQVALKYYHQQNAVDVFNSIYLIGDESRASVEFHLGGKEQNNDPHFVELYGALAGIDFFKIDQSDKRECVMIARDQSNSMEWNDLPLEIDDKKKIEQVTRFAFAFLHVYLPKINDIKKHGKEWTAPWYIDLFDRSGVSTKDSNNKLEYLEDYCKKFLTWLAHIQYSAVTNIAGDIPNSVVELVNYLAFADIKADIKDDKRLTLKDPSYFNNEEFYSLILPAGKEDRNVLNKLWKYMCSAKVKDKEADGVGKFVNALYTQCGKIQ